MQGVKKIPVLTHVKNVIAVIAGGVFTILLGMVFSGFLKNIVKILACVVFLLVLLLFWISISWFEDRSEWDRELRDWQESTKKLTKEKELADKNLQGQTVLLRKAEISRDKAEKELEYNSAMYSVLLNIVQTEYSRKEVTDNVKNIQNH
ncbi:hypothetical protein [Lacticaseibacillus paracasei]|uniref:hypothetical protein n=1 Tax=Lacticaseibacillus paracasei TaxID=1597 RepID=UPI00205A311F|nr:hypothetical protein [Lacticaseibacillus paracasei]MDM7528830.1 hypothetical protein [Lacticaseibacillus paracasei]MDM7540891.1 hypothetical protein [Lacticaseibacillus paracasei]DAM29094.1 MAG TPA: cell division protein [Caudoviricetes sp.]